MKELSWINEARKYIGLREIKGVKHNPKILEWLDDMGKYGTESKAKQSKAKQSKAKQSKAKQSKAKQSKAKQSKAKQSKAKQSKAWWREDETPWCGLFVGHCLGETGRCVVKNWFRAREWDNAQLMTRLNKPAYSCIVTFTRQNGGMLVL